MMALAFGLCLFAASSVATTTTPPPPSPPSYRPVVLMHGLLANGAALDTLKGWIEHDFPGIYVTSLSFCDGLPSLFTNMNTQVDMFAKAVQSDPVGAARCWRVGTFCLCTPSLTATATHRNWRTASTSLATRKAAC